MEALKQLEQLFEDVAYLKERDKILTHTVRELMLSVPDEMKGYEEVARFLGVSKRTVTMLVSTKAIPFNKTGERTTFSRKGLLEYKEDKRLKRNPHLPSVLKL